MLRSCVFAVVLALSSGPPCARAAEPWPNTALNRWQAEALVQTFNADVLSARSATLVLEKWCGAHHLAPEAKVVAISDVGAVKPISAEQRKRLQIPEGEPVKYRHVRLTCGDRVLSEADNWYVPSRLTEEMNRQLETTTTPFGKVVAPLQPYRQTFEVDVLYRPLETPASAATLTLPQAIFEHHAVLYTKGALPFSEVDEVYQGQALDFAPMQ